MEEIPNPIVESDRNRESPIIPVFDLFERDRDSGSKESVHLVREPLALLLKDLVVE
jgi:hypothetical protein